MKLVMTNTEYKNLSGEERVKLIISEFIAIPFGILTFAIRIWALSEALRLFWGIDLFAILSNLSV